MMNLLMLKISALFFQMYDVFSFGTILYTCVIYGANIKVSQCPLTPHEEVSGPQ